MESILRADFCEKMSLETGTTIGSIFLSANIRVMCYVVCLSVGNWSLTYSSFADYKRRLLKVFLLVHESQSSIIIKGSVFKKLIEEARKAIPPLSFLQPTLPSSHMLFRGCRLKELVKEILTTVKSRKAFIDYIYFILILKRISTTKLNIIKPNKNKTLYLLQYRTI